MKTRLNRKKPKNPIVWPIIILILAIFISFTFSIISELTLNGTHLVVAIVVIVIFITISILADVIGLAVASSDVEHFTAMASRKVKGSKQAILLIKNADKVSSILNDVIGDVCGILSGAAGASIIAKIAIDNANNFLAILIPSLIASVIAGLTIFGKAIFKRIAVKNANSITLKFSKFINFFTRKG